MDVVIAPARLLGKNNRGQTTFPINETPHLPLGDKSAIVNEKFDDRYVTTEHKPATIADSIERNSEYYQQQEILVNLDLVGKKTNNRPVHVHDQSIMSKFNKNNNERRILDRYNEHITAEFNLVATPFTTAESVFPDIYDT